MGIDNSAIRHQIRLIEEAMKEAGIWCDTVPSWVQEYKGNSAPDIWEWLQFVQLPLRAIGVMRPSQYLAPQVTAIAQTLLKGDSILIQRIVELDSMTSTLSHS